MAMKKQLSMGAHFRPGKFVTSNGRNLQMALDTLPASLQRQVLRQVISKAGVKIAGEIRKATPRSKLTGTTLKLSSESARARGGRGLDHLKKSVARKPSSKWRNNPARKGIIGVSIGHDQQKQGNHAHLLALGHKAVYWGRRTTERVKADEYFKKTWKKTMPQVAKMIQQDVKKKLASVVAKNAAKNNVLNVGGSP